VNVWPVAFEAPSLTIITAGEMDITINLRCKNPEPLMSALGHNRTFAQVCAMSALPLKADIG
jgi:hypothetical protein